MRHPWNSLAPIVIRRAAWLVLLVACSKASPSEECRQILDDPAHAMPRLGERYVGDPVKIAEVVERCVAPSGNECERLEKIIRAIPQLSPGMPSAPGNSLELCRAMPPAMRHCMLPSYLLAHGDECAKLRAQMAKTALPSLDIEPSGTPAPASNCDEPTLSLDATGATLTTKHERWRLDGVFDATWLEAKLRAIKQLECSALELKTGDGVPYQTALDAMDTAVKVGFIDPELEGTIDPAAPLPPRANPARAKDGVTGLQQAPVVRIGKTDVEVAGTPVATVAALATGNARIEPLVAALADKQRNLVILQADAATDGHVINRVVGTLRSAGFDNVLFAVKNK
ncbi:MAG TPA: hypothetical protein VGM88_27240 [Kofleriaceae bacterium]|jgi:biopolymer transport protein ExbD